MFNSYSRWAYGDNCFFGDNANKRMHRRNLSSAGSVVVNNFINCCGHGGSGISLWNGLKYGLGLSLGRGVMCGLANVFSGGAFCGGLTGGGFEPFGLFAGNYTSNDTDLNTQPLSLNLGRRARKKVKTVIKEVEVEKVVEKIVEKPVYDIDNEKISQFVAEIAGTNNVTALAGLKKRIQEALDDTDDIHKAADTTTYENLLNLIEDREKELKDARAAEKANAAAEAAVATENAGEPKIVTNSELVAAIKDGNLPDLDKIVDNLTIASILDLAKDDLDKLPEEQKGKLKAELEADLASLKSDEGSPYNYKFTHNNRLLSELALLCKLDPSIKVGVLTREQSADQWILGSIRDVKVDASGTISWTVDNRGTATNNTVEGIYNFTTTGCTATIFDGDTAERGKLTTQIEYIYNKDKGYYENKTLKPTVGL